jgi:Arc/MetJ family transcription regulator
METQSAMRVNIEIDGQLLRQAMLCSGARSKKKKDAEEAGLRLLIKTHAQTAIRELRGQVQWEGDLGQSRLGHV